MECLETANAFSLERHQIHAQEQAKKEAEMILRYTQMTVTYGARGVGKIFYGGSPA
jgi:hypothetical protein